MRESQINTRRGAPRDAPSGKIFISEVYLTLSKYVYNFNFLALIVFELWGSQIYATGRCTREAPLEKRFSFPKSAPDPL